MDAIRKHAADARWLDALDALDALSADEIDDEALAAEVEMSCDIRDLIEEGG